MPFATTALLGLLSFWQAPEVTCVAQGGEFLYPALARAASIQGVVVIHTVVGEDGIIAFADYEGHPLIAFPVAESIMSVRFPANCAGREVNLHLEFRLVESGAEGSSVIAANEWLIQRIALQPMVNRDPVGFEIKPKLSWWKRIFRRR